MPDSISYLSVLSTSLFIDCFHLCVLQLANSVAAINPPRWVSGCTHEMKSSKGKFICLGFFHFSHPSENSNISLKMLSKKTEKQIVLRVRTQYGWEGPLKESPSSLQRCQKIAPRGLKIKWKKQGIRKTGSPKPGVSIFSSHHFFPFLRSC